MTDYRLAPGEAQEDQITASIEKFTAQIPSSVYLAAAIASMGVSLAFKAKRDGHHNALFIGQWAAPFLILGLYNKLVKQHGSDASARSTSTQQEPDPVASYRSR
jgi:hypothetical protein